MKKQTPHHTILATGGRVASRRIVRPTKKITSRATASGMDLGITPAWMRRTRPKGSTLGLGA